MRNPVPVIALIGMLAGWPAAVWAQETPPDLTSIGLEAVMDIEVTSVSKKPEKLMNAPAAVVVITAEEIKRSGVTSLPDLLRLVPGVQVSRIDSHQWAVGVRGFASALSRSLLVLIDGRSVYSPLFAGVYWDTQNVLFENIERIEVIRGPGATLWGANAVNGVINIITKNAHRTQGTVASAGAGNMERVRGVVQSGWETAGGTAVRAYGSYFDRDAEFHQDGDEYDSWHMTQGGFRLDSDPREQDHITFQGDAYEGKVGEQTLLSMYSAPFARVVTNDAELNGGNLLGRWTHRAPEGGESTLQFYYDRTHRRHVGFTEDRDTLDIEYQHHVSMGTRHDVLWGAGYRLTSGDTESVPTIEFDPEDRTDDVLSAFIQDEVQIIPSKLALVVGSKFEHNDYTGFNYQPNARVIVTPTAKHMLWAAVSRALRVPSRVEEDLALTAVVDPTTPVFARAQGTKDFDPERLTAYEIGYRVQPAGSVFVDLAFFHNEYDRLLSLEPGTPFVEASPAPAHLVIPFLFRNKMRAHVHGAELAVEWRQSSSLRFGGTYSYLNMNLFSDRDSLDPSTETRTEGSSPRHMASLRTSIDFPRGIGADVALRHVGSLPSQQVKAYTEMDVSVNWHLARHLDIIVSGQNLLSAHHPEFAGGSSDSIEISRSVYGRLVLRW